MPDLIKKPALPPPVNDLQKQYAEQDLKETNPNIYYVRGKRVNLDPSLTTQAAYEKTRDAAFPDLKPEEMLPANPQLHKSSVSPDGTNTLLEIGRGLARPAAYAAGTAGAAALTGGGSLIPQIGGVAAALATDLLFQQAQGEHRKTSFTEDAGVVDKNSTLGKVAASAEGMVEDYAGGKVLGGIAKGVKKMLPSKTTLASEAANAVLQETGTFAQTHGQFLAGMENYGAQQAKRTAMTVQGRELEAAAVKTLRGGARPQDVIATDIVQNVYKLGNQVDSKLAELGDNLIALSNPAPSMSTNMLKAFGAGQPGEEVVKLTSAKEWALNFTKFNKGRTDVKDLLKVADDILKSPDTVPFREAYNAYFSSGVAREGVDSLVGIAKDKNFQALRQATEADISNSISGWKNAAEASGIWSKITGVRQEAESLLSNQNTLYKLIESSKKPVEGIESILNGSPQQLNALLASKTLSVPGVGKVSNNIHEDLKTYVIKRAFDSAKTPEGMLNPQKLLEFSNDFPAKRSLFTASERADLDQFFKDAAYIAKNAPTQQLSAGHPLKMTAEGIFLAQSLLLGSSVGGRQIAMSIVGAELGSAALGSLLVKRPAFARTLGRLMKAEPLGMPIGEVSKTLFGNTQLQAGLLNGLQGALHLQDGTKIPGYWEGGVFKEGNPPPKSEPKKLSVNPSALRGKSLF